MNKQQITVTMPIAEYEDLVTDAKWWQGRFNDLKKVVLKYTTNNKDGSYVIRDCANLVKDIEAYLNDEDY